MKNFLRGLIVGGILGVLFAPQSGEKTRQDIRETVDELGHDLDHATESAQSAGENIQGSAASTLASVRDRVGEAIHRIRVTLNDTKEDLQARAENDEVTSAEEALADDYSYTQTASRVVDSDEPTDPERTIVQAHARVVED